MKAVNKGPKLYVYIIGYDANNYAELFKEIVDSKGFVTAARQSGRRYCVEDFRNIEFVNISSEEEYERILADDSIWGLFLIKDQFYPLDKYDIPEYIERNQALVDRFIEKGAKLANSRHGYVMVWDTWFEDLADSMIDGIEPKIAAHCLDLFGEFYIQLYRNPSRTDYDHNFYQFICPIINKLLTGEIKIDACGNNKKKKRTNGDGIKSEASGA